MRRRTLLLTAIAAPFATWAVQARAHEFEVGSLAIEHPWSRATPPGAQVAGGFLEVENRGAVDDRLIAVHADISERIELHISTMTNGVMQMRPLPDGIPVPAGTTIILAPGGLHIMFIGLRRSLAEGDSFAATLDFEHAGSVAVEFAVQAAGSEAGHDQSQ